MGVFPSPAASFPRLPPLRAAALSAGAGAPAVAAVRGRAPGARGMEVSLGRDGRLARGAGEEVEEGGLIEGVAVVVVGEEGVEVVGEVVEGGEGGR